MEEQRQQQQGIPMNKPKMKVWTGAIEDVEEAYATWLEDKAVNITIVNPKVDDNDVTRMTLVIFYLIATV